MDESWVGLWTGENLLNLSWLESPEHFSEATLRAERVAGGFLAVSYTWSHEGAAHDGFLLIGPDGLSAAWGDSWHQSESLMHLRGAANRLEGTYPASEGPDWGWRMELDSPKEDALTLIMTNISPEGEEELAVRMTLTRSEG